MPKNKAIHITYIGRLVQEKGILIVLECIKRSILEKRNIVWHICGDGEYIDNFKEMNHPWVIVHWYVDKNKLIEILSYTDMVFMPSLFLETFGLVALETLVYWVPVCGFSKWWLQDFISPVLCLDSENPVNSFFAILDKKDFPVMNVSNYTYDLWIKKLRELTDWQQKILLVNDYISNVGWAEEYVLMLRDSLISIGKDVELFGYTWRMSRSIRITFMLLTPFAFWRKSALFRKIKIFSPDIIWMHSISRYIGPHWLSAIYSFECKKYITHHDLGIISPRPSQIYNESDIPLSPNIGDWIPKQINIFLIVLVLWKWAMISWLWLFLRTSNTLHILPSKWMLPYFQKYVDTIPCIFPHTIRNNNSVK